MVKHEWHRESRHLVEAYVWVLLAIPSVLWWKESIVWVILISLYANYKTAISAYEGSRARKAAEGNTIVGEE